MLDIKTVVLGEIEENCYIVTDKATGKAAVIDPGEYSPALEAALSEVGFGNIEYILLTHGHFDHIGGVRQLRQKTEGVSKTAIYYTEEDFLRDPRKNRSGAFNRVPLPPTQADILLHDGDRIDLGDSTFTVLHTPGHTSGSICYICGRDLFCGDTLFCRSAGRTDLPTGSTAELMESLRKIKELDGDFIIHTGHGRETTLNEERFANPYLRGGFGFDFI